MARYAIKIGGTYDGVRLVDSADTPFPEGALYPVPYWDQLQEVPERHRIVDAGVVRVMSPTEKLAADDPVLDALKVEKIKEIDERTEDLILNGTGFPFNGKFFSMSEHAQQNWSNLLHVATTVAIGVTPNESVFPIGIACRDESEYVINSYVAVFSFILQGYMPGLEGIKATGRSLKARVNGATTAAALAAIIDTR